MDEEKPSMNWSTSADWHSRSELRNWSVHSDRTYWVCIRHAYQDNPANRAAIRNNRITHTHTHHALIGNCHMCLRAGFVGMRCSCNTGNRTRYITHTLMGIDHEDMYPLQPDPIKICMYDILLLEIMKNLNSFCAATTFLSHMCLFKILRFLKFNIQSTRLDSYWVLLLPAVVKLYMILYRCIRSTETPCDFMLNFIGGKILQKKISTKK